MKGQLATSLEGYAVRTFEVKLGTPAKTLAPIRSQAVALKYDLATATEDGVQAKTGFDANKDNLPTEMLPTTLPYGGITFKLGPTWTDKPNAVVARGQTINLPMGKFNRIYILAAADGDQKAAFKVGDSSAELNIQNWKGYIGQWDTRTWRDHTVELPTPKEPAPTDHSWQAEKNRKDRAYIKEHGPLTQVEPDYTGLKPGFVKTAPVAWFSSHHHNAQGGNEPYAYCYLFGYTLDVTEGATTLTLPDNDKIRIMAVTVADEAGKLHPAQPLVDSLETRESEGSK